VLIVGKVIFRAIERFLGVRVGMYGFA